MKKILLFFYVFTMIKSANFNVTLEPNGMTLRESVNGGQSTTWAWATATWDIYVKLNPNLYWDGGSSNENYSCGQFNNNNSVTITPCPSWLSSLYSNYNRIQYYYNTIQKRKERNMMNPLSDFGNELTTLVDKATNTRWMRIQKQLGTSLVQLGIVGKDFQPLLNSLGRYTCATFEENGSTIETKCPWLETTTTN